jgi:nucleotide-binding universal stress UspA family protein
MFKHILVPVDGSSTALLAMDKAIELAKAFGGRITAIHVIDQYPFVGIGADYAYGQTDYLAAPAHARRCRPPCPWHRLPALPARSA